MKTQELKIAGMTCGHCVMSVRKGLEAVPGLVVERVEIGGAVVRFDETKVQMNTIKKTIEEAGYSLLT